jgi:hypothetical protein
LSSLDTSIQIARDKTTETARSLKGVSREIGDFSHLVERHEGEYRPLGKKHEVVHEALRTLGEPVSVVALHHYLDRQGYTITPETVRNRLAALVKSGEATTNGGTGKKGDAVLYTAVDGISESLKKRSISPIISDDREAA